MVSNQVLVARAVDFGDLEAVRVAVEMTHHYLNLALEHLAGGDLQSAIEHLRDTPLKLLFRLGVSLTIDLRTSTELTLRKLGLSSVKVREIPYLDSPYREALSGFMARQPRYLQRPRRQRRGRDARFQQHARFASQLRDSRSDRFGRRIVPRVVRDRYLVAELPRTDGGARRSPQPACADRPRAPCAGRPPHDRSDRRQQAECDARRDYDRAAAASSATNFAPS